MKSASLDLTLIDILLVLAIRERTGELVVESGNNIGTIVLYKGRILQAFSPYSKAIGDLLVESGKITDSELIETLKLQKRTAYCPLGSLLFKMGRVTMEMIEQMVHEQIRSSVKEFSSWPNVQFNLAVKNVTPCDGIYLGVKEFLPSEILDSLNNFLAYESPKPAIPGTEKSITAES